MNLWHLIRYGHLEHDLIHGRHRDGRLTGVCTLCGFTRVVLCEEVVIGPAHQFTADQGAVTTKAKRVVPDNVRTWKRSER